MATDVVVVVVVVAVAAAAAAVVVVVVVASGLRAAAADLRRCDFSGGGFPSISALGGRLLAPGPSGTDPGRKTTPRGKGSGPLGPRIEKIRSADVWVI